LPPDLPTPEAELLWLEVPAVSDERMAEMARSLQRLLEGATSGPGLAGLASELATLLEERPPLPRLLARLATSIAGFAGCDEVLLSWTGEGETHPTLSHTFGDQVPTEKLVGALEALVRSLPARPGTADLVDCSEVLPPDLGEPPVRAACLLPLRMAGRLPGYVALFWRRPLAFTPACLELARGLTSQVLVVIQSAHLSEESSRRSRELGRHREQLQTLVSQAGAVLSSALNLNQLLQDILELALKLLRVDAGSLSLVENQRATRQVTLVAPGATHSVHHRVRASLVGWKEPQPQRVQTTETHVLGAVGGQYAASLFVPLVLQDRVKAHLALFSRRPRRFEGDEVRLLEAFTVQAAMAIENAQVFEAEQRRAREATALYQAARGIGAGQSLSQVLEASCRALTQIAEVDRCLVFLEDRDRPAGSFTLRACSGLSPDQQEFFEAYRLSLSHLSEEHRRRIDEGRPITFEGAPRESPGLARLLALLPSSNALLVPLVAEQRLLGLILLDESRGAHHFPPPVIWLVMTLSVQVAGAIQRAQLIEELGENLERLRALYQVSTAVTGTLSLTRVIQMIAQEAGKLLGDSASALLVLDETGYKFLSDKSGDLPPELLDPAVQAAIAQTAIKRKRAASLYLDREEARTSEVGALLARNGFGGLLSVPLVARRKMLGVLNCFAPEGRRYSRSEIRLLRGFANHAATALENARLHGQLRYRMGELGTLLEVSKAVTSTLDLHKVLREIVRHVRQVLRADACSLMLLENGNLVMKAAEGLDPALYSVPLPLGQGVTALAVETGRPMVLLDQEGEGREEFPEPLRAEGFRAVLTTPIKSRGDTLGLVNVYYRGEARHTPTEINLLTMLGSQVAVAIENARIYAEKERQAWLFHRVLIPREKLEFPGLVVGHRFEPSLGDLSADYYDLIPLGKERCALVIADVAGKGAEAAIQTVRIKHIVQAYAMAGYSPGQILGLLNHHLVADPSLDTRPVTVFCAEVHVARRRLRFASAGHEPPALLSPEGEVTLLEASGIMIAATEDPYFEERTLSLPEGSCLVLYTDGITEARTPEGEFFGLERLVEAVRQHHHLPPQSLANAIYRRVRDFAGRHLTDDFSVLVVRF
jgi:GAF domain-containing protein